MRTWKALKYADCQNTCTLCFLGSIFFKESLNKEHLLFLIFAWHLSGRVGDFKFACFKGKVILRGRFDRCISHLYSERTEQQPCSQWNEKWTWRETLKWCQNVEALRLGITEGSLWPPVFFPPFLINGTIYWVQGEAIGMSKALSEWSFQPSTLSTKERKYKVKNFISKCLEKVLVLLELFHMTSINLHISCKDTSSA